MGIKLVYLHAGARDLCNKLYIFLWISAHPIAKIVIAWFLFHSLQALLPNPRPNSIWNLSYCCWTLERGKGKGRKDRCLWTAGNAGKRKYENKCPWIVLLDLIILRIAWRQGVIIACNVAWKTVVRNAHIVLVACRVSSLEKTTWYS